MQKILYILAVGTFIALSVFIFFIIKAQTMTLYSDFVLITIFNLILLASSGAINFFLYKNNKFLFWYGILLVSLLIMFSSASNPAFEGDLHFYYYMSLGAIIVMLVSLVGNIIKVEKTEDAGFGIWMHMKKYNSFLTLAIVWITVFFLMGVLVSASGHTFIGYPKFAVGSIEGSLMSGFGVGDWENIVLMLLPFTITYALVYHFSKNKFLAVLGAIAIGILAFTIYHTVRYETNFGALVSVALFSMIGLSIYGALGLVGMGLLGLVIMSAMHIGNNFWGNLFDKSVWALQSYSSNVKIAGFDVTSFELLIVCIVIFYSLYNICHNGGFKWKKEESLT